MRASFRQDFYPRAGEVSFLNPQVYSRIYRDTGHPVGGPDLRRAHTTSGIKVKLPYPRRLPGNPQCGRSSTVTLRSVLIVLSFSSSPATSLVWASYLV